jgi:xylulokinase
MSRDQMPALVEGSAAGTLRAELAQRWGMAKPPVDRRRRRRQCGRRGGAGRDQPGDAFVSLGTSGVLWATTAGFAPNPRPQSMPSALRADTWHQMGVILSAASCLSWLSGFAASPRWNCCANSATTLKRPSPVLFLPYLSGERTPHNDADIRGAFVGLSHDTTRARNDSRR